MCVTFTDARVEKRPILRPPIASPYAGASVPKVVYISAKTPFMCAIKRVQKLLGHAEKRATSKVDLSNKKISDKAKLEQVVQADEALKKESVLIMATGRAIDKAMSLENWFREKGDEYDVNVRTKAVLVVDDILPDSRGENGAGNGDDNRQTCEPRKTRGGDQEASDPNCQGASPSGDDVIKDPKLGLEETKSMRRRRRARVRKPLNSDGEPTSRTRYVNGVEIAVSLR